MSLYGLVAWPPHALSAWMREVQREHGLAAFGAPHLNVRTPFEFRGTEADLVEGAARLAAETSPFEVSVLNLKPLRSMVFVLVDQAPALLALHAAALELLPAPPSERDGPGYLPHLTLALGVTPWAEAQVWNAVGHLKPPVERFSVTELALTREHRGDVLELGRYTLGSGEFTM